MNLHHAKDLFEIRHSDRTLHVWRSGHKHFKHYIGAINGKVCAIGPAKGDLLRRLIDMSRSYPKAESHRVARPGKSR